MAIYFCENEKYLKIGFTDNLAKRMGQHAYNHDLELLAAIPGDSDTEGLLKRDPDIIRFLQKGSEWFERNEYLYEWIWQLLEKEFATAKIEFLEHYPELPYSVWNPRVVGAARTDHSGQALLWDKLPPRQRISMRGSIGYLHSITDEWYTQKEWIDLARATMGSIDTDPATTVAVNLKFINAKTFYTKNMSGLDRTKPWIGNVWLNPPYGRGDNSASEFIRRLIEELVAGNIKQAITCLNLNSMCSSWFYKQIPQTCSAHCIAYGRPDFLPPNAMVKISSPSKGIVFTYFGKDASPFVKIFGPHGQILPPRWIS